VHASRLDHVPSALAEPLVADVVARHPGYADHDVARLVIVPGKIVNVVLR